MIVRALFDKDVAPWVREWPSYYVTAMDDTTEGLMVEMKVRSEQEILQWLLSWGSRVRVIAPESLSRMIVEEAAKILKHHRMRC
jgi:predicted DNA-binding transcriptional regulator YafY